MANDKRQDEIIEEFSVFDEWLDKYEYLIGLSDTLPAIAPEHRTDQYLIQGCQSRVWIDARYEDACGARSEESLSSAQDASYA